MVVVPYELLPVNESARRRILRAYFPQQAITCSPTLAGWQIDLSWHSNMEHYVDPKLLEGLSWWSSECGIEDIPLAVRSEAHFQLSLEDSWTLFGWSRWLSRRNAQSGLPHEVVLLHVDDHDDLMTPRIVLAPNEWMDAITGRRVDLSQPHTVASAIKSGAIGFGSFITPLLHTVPVVHVRHLCATEYSLTRTGLHDLERRTVADDLLRLGALRPAVGLMPHDKQTGSRAADVGTYTVTSDPAIWLKDLPSSPLLLHIDADYFNNRFNGDSDWHQTIHHHNPPQTTILQAVDTIFDALRAYVGARQIVSVCVALSPGFFPAEFWAPTTSAILDGIDGLVGSNLLELE